MSDDRTSPGTLIGSRFLLKSQLGGGGAAVVWLAEDLETKGPVAVKLLHRKFREFGPILTRLTREAQLLFELEHPNIARAIAFELDAVQPYIALEYVQGSTLLVELGARSKGDDYFGPGLLVRLIEGLFGAVEHAHERGVIHRDLKPVNIMLQATEQGAAIKILDFGIAKLIEHDASSATTQGRTLGTVSFMSPEQAKGDPVDPRTDVYALGIILYELVTLRRAWAQDAAGQAIRAYAEPLKMTKQNTAQSIFQRILRQEYAPPSQVRPGLDARVDALIQRALMVDRELRFPSVSAFKAEALGLFSEREETDAAEADPGTRYTELRTQTFVPDRPPSPPPAFTPSALKPSARIPPEPKKRAAGILLFAGGLSVGVLATVLVLTLLERPVEIQSEPVTINSNPQPGPLAKAAQVLVLEEVDVTSNPPAAGKSPEPRPQRRANLEERAPRGESEAPTPAGTGAGPGVEEIEKLLEGAREKPEDTAVLDRLHQLFLKTTLQVGDEKTKRRLQRIADTNQLSPSVEGWSSAVNELKKALEP